jgi:hypothetical protein
MTDDALTWLTTPLTTRRPPFINPSWKPLRCNKGCDEPSVLSLNSRKVRLLRNKAIAGSIGDRW